VLYAKHRHRGRTEAPPGDAQDRGGELLRRTAGLNA
jgi:hypothetical protein